MTLTAAPRRPLWLATLLGGIGPMLVAWLIAVVMRQLWIAELDQGHMFEGDGKEHIERPAAMFTSGWFADVGEMLMWFAIAFLGVQVLLFLFVKIAERRHAQPPVAWLCAGVVATTPLVLYSIWPDANVPTWQILFVYFFGIAAAWITRRLRYGAWL